MILNKRRKFNALLPYLGSKVKTNNGTKLLGLDSNDNDISINDVILFDYKLILTPLSEILERDVIAIAELYHPGNDRCTILRKVRDTFIVDVDSSSSTEYSLEIELNFNIKNPKHWGSSYHGSTYSNSITDISRVSVFTYLQYQGYDVQSYFLSGENLYSCNLCEYKDVVEKRDDKLEILTNDN